MKSSAISRHLEKFPFCCVPDIQILVNVQSGSLRSHHVIHPLNSISDQIRTQGWHVSSTYNLEYSSRTYLKNVEGLYYFPRNIWSLWIHSCLCLFQSFLDDRYPPSFFSMLPVNNCGICHWRWTQFWTFSLK